VTAALQKLEDGKKLPFSDKQLQLILQNWPIFVTLTTKGITSAQNFDYFNPKFSKSEDFQPLTLYFCPSPCQLPLISNIQLKN